ncbi:hypothetical protein EON80_02540 [bacterium]|nr:MAG: hypothetical protein EON80_02540 [bacterium]
MEHNIIPLESIHIASPCHADWDKMSGDDKSRFCGSCAKHVYNLSAMTNAEAQRLIQEKEGHLCVQMHRREDGTVITADCPVGISPVRRSAGVFRALMATAMAAVLGLFGVRGAQSAPTQKAATHQGRRVRGRMVVRQPKPTATPMSPELIKLLQTETGRMEVPRPKPAPASVKRGEMSVTVSTPVAELGEVMVVPTPVPVKPKPSGHSN